MVIKEAKEFMERIKQHYQDFIIDDTKIKEWFKELKDYELKDVNDKLDAHLKNEFYGHSIPKVHFLTRGLVKEKDKGKQLTGTTTCHICHKFIKFEEFDKHFDRCPSVNYLRIQNDKYFNKGFDRQKLMEMSQEEFDNLYDKVLKQVHLRTEDINEKKRIEMYWGIGNYKVEEIM